MNKKLLVILIIASFFLGAFSVYLSAPVLTRTRLLPLPEPSFEESGDRSNAKLGGFGFPVPGTVSCYRQLCNRKWIFMFRKDIKFPEEFKPLLSKCYDVERKIDGDRPPILCYKTPLIKGHLDCREVWRW